MPKRKIPRYSKGQSRQDGASRAPSERIDGTQRPTKMPSFSLPPKKRMTERISESAAARMKSALAFDFAEARLVGMAELAAGFFFCGLESIPK